MAAVASPIPEDLPRDVQAWSGCVAGAPANSCRGVPVLPEGVRLVRGFVRATKPLA